MGRRGGRGVGGIRSLIEEKMSELGVWGCGSECGRGHEG